MGSINSKYQKTNPNFVALFFFVDIWNLEIVICNLVWNLTFVIWNFLKLIAC